MLAPREDREELVERLHELGAVQIADVSLDDEDGEDIPLGVPFEPETGELRLALGKADFVLELLQRFDETKSGLVSAFLQKRVHLSFEEYSTISERVDLEGLYRELEDLDIRLRRVEGAISDLKAEREDLEPWRALDYPLGELENLGVVEAGLGAIPRGSLPAWEEEMESRCPYAAWERVGEKGETVFLLALVHRDEHEEFGELAGRHGFEPVRFEGKSGTVEEEIEALEKRLAAETAEKEGIKESIRSRLPLKPSLLALDDYLYNQLKKEEIKASFIHTPSVVALEGWVEESREEEVRQGLNRLGENLDVSFRPPRDEELPPTVLRNGPRLGTAESLIDLFGSPRYDETDPTPIVAPFYILFFGMCVGDVGYGIVLTLGFWWALRKLDLSDSVRRFLRLFMYCGIATILVGIFTRGYFGIEGESLPAFLKFPGTMDVLNNPVPMMLLCAALGLIHISIGVAIEMYDNMRQNSIWRGICEQGTTLLFWLGIAVMAVGYGAKVDALGQAGMYIMAAGVLGIVLLSNIGSRSLAGKFFGGLYNLYGLFSGTIGDVASYLRLYALGLATVAIGNVVNEMAGLVWGIPVLGIVLLAVILAGGHIFNLAINFLSAFVHPLRLQYVEFFGKFYEDGGETFAPFRLETRKTVIDEG